MNTLMTEHEKLATYLRRRYNLSWNDYIKRFEGTAPLELHSTGLYPCRLEPEEIESEISLLGYLSSPWRLKRFEKEYRLVAGFKHRVNRREIESMSYVYPNFAMMDVLVHQRVVDIMLRICPDDFEPIPVTLVTLNRRGEHFETKNFYALNVLTCVNAFVLKSDASLKEINQNGNGLGKIYRKDDPWRDGLRNFRSVDTGVGWECDEYTLDAPCKIALAVSKERRGVGVQVIWHPELAKALPVHSLTAFYVR